MLNLFSHQNRHCSSKVFKASELTKVFKLHLSKSWRLVNTETFRPILRKNGLISAKCDELICLLNRFYLFLSNNGLTGIEILKGIEKHLREISRLLPCKQQ